MIVTDVEMARWERTLAKALAHNAALAGENAALREAGQRILTEGFYRFDENMAQYLRVDARSIDNPVMQLKAALASPSPAVLRVEAAVKLAEAYTWNRDAHADAPQQRDEEAAWAAYVAADAACKAPKGAEGKDNE